jgi:pimeloyl-ACP methyl ester carboxylesterase
MTEPQYIESPDHKHIAYDVTGNGPAIVLLHGGFIQSRLSWYEAGYVERLSKEFTVITVDLRGHGESDRPVTPEDYAPDRLIEDIKDVVDACNVTRYYILGYSLGGTVGLQIASRVKEVIGAILVGVWFGKLFTPEDTAMAMARIEVVERARKEGVFDQLDMAPNEKVIFSQVDTSIMKNFGTALVSYPPIEPAELKCPTLMIAGTANQPAASKLKEREDDMSKSGVSVRFLEGLDHVQEFSEIDKVLPECLEFLHILQSR